jgi:hypothetical protein
MQCHAHIKFHRARANMLLGSMLLHIIRLHVAVSLTNYYSTMVFAALRGGHVLGSTAAGRGGQRAWWRYSAYRG